MTNPWLNQPDCDPFPTEGAPMFIDDTDLNYPKDPDVLARQEQRRLARRMKRGVDGCYQIAWHTTPDRPLGIPRRALIDEPKEQQP